MTYRRSFALPFVALLAACGGNGGSGDLVGTGNEPPPFNDQAPTTDPQQPGDSFGETPNDTDQAARNPEAPPVGSSPGVVVSSGACEEICSVALAAGCREETPGACVSGCTNPDPEDAACADENVALFYCIVHAPDFACENGDFDIDLEYITAHCPAEAQALLDCEGFQNPDPPDPPDPPASCDLNGDGCAGCADVCSACVCAAAGDTSQCTDFCI